MSVKCVTIFHVRTLVVTSDYGMNIFWCAEDLKIRVPVGLNLLFSLCLWFPNIFCVCALQLYTFLETTMNTLVLLPNFINFFSEAKSHSTSPGNLAVVFVTFGRSP